MSLFTVTMTGRVGEEETTFSTTVDGRTDRDALMLAYTLCRFPLMDEVYQVTTSRMDK